jgi:hypothetical protein
MPVFIEVFRALASRQRMFGGMQLAEGEELESNILQAPPCNQNELAGGQRTLPAAKGTPNNN